ncbi:MAG: hypothetical protein EOM43_23855 [Gammaproteobacteria bacterium]|nr:hypothetical protein [Gammaproteobacteria bacterium]
MNTQPKITIKKRGRIWEVDCPHCFKPFGSIYIFDSFTGAVAGARKHLRTRHTTHRAYIAWHRIAGEPVARCHDCNWHTITTPFQAAAQHLKESK